MPIIGSFGAGSAGGYGQRKGGGVPFNIEYLVIGGGGNGGPQTDDTGAGGGFRTNVPGSTSGGGAPAEPSYEVITGVEYTVTVGAGAYGGGAGPLPRPGPFAKGGSSVFDTITSIGGGSGGPTANPNYPTLRQGGSGAGRFSAPNWSGTPGQGYPGGNNGGAVEPYNGTAGGGGAGQAGNSGSSGSGGPGGAGQTSSITGSPTQYAGGGGGGSRPGGPQGAGGAGGGGAGNATHQSAATPGTANTGGGGGCQGYNNQPPGNPYAIIEATGNGGSGFISLKMPSDFTATFTPGVTATPNISVPGYQIYSVTAAGPSDTVTFSKG